MIYRNSLLCDILSLPETYFSKEKEKDIDKYSLLLLNRVHL